MKPDTIELDEILENYHLTRTNQDLMNESSFKSCGCLLSIVFIVLLIGVVVWVNV